MLHVIDQNSRHPPGGWQYTHADDGHITTHILLDECYKTAVKYRRINNYPIPGNFRQQFEDQVCKHVPEGFCTDAETGQPFVPLRRKPLTATEVLSGSKFLVAFLAKGEYAEDEEIKQRIAICVSCDDNVSFKGGCLGCAASKAAHKLMEEVVARKRFPDDGKLRACNYCGCSNKAQTRVKISFLHEHLTDEINQQLPDHCWKKRK